MRTIRTKVYKFSELSEQAKQKAIEDHIEYMIKYEHHDHYENWPEYREAIDEADRLQTPWFAAQIVYEKCGKDGSIANHLNECYEFYQDGGITPF